MHLSTSISCGSYSYGVLQPSLYLPPEHFFKGKTFPQQKIEEVPQPCYMMTVEGLGIGLGIEVGLSSSGPTLSKTKLKQIIIIFRKTKLTNALGLGIFLLLWGFFSLFFSFCVLFSYMQDSCLFVETIPRNIIPENTWVMVIYDSML